MNYAISPGLYALGDPGRESEVLVTANYKLTFDSLRSQLAGRHLWILVLDTRGINVWCAAGKGTFGTDELIHRIRETKLAERVTHGRIILPQLGAPGVAAYKVKQETGFRVLWGPVEATDLQQYLDGGKTASARMRRKEFPFRERLVLIPIELVPVLKVVLMLQVIFLLFSGLLGTGTFTANMAHAGLFAVASLVAALIAGVIITPLLLPFLPGRAFSGKSILPALLLIGLLTVSMRGMPSTWQVRFEVAGWVLMAGAIASFYAVNFTGASTFTSLSGVKKELRLAIPIQVGSALSGLVLWAVSLRAF
ncbi:acetyl-CoA synthase subunit gamma [Myxococcota bacterium]|nr:acetyl-CoA synthase subunit gamma [Myxococcota bacterium]